jgi:hypothetical protein
MRAEPSRAIEQDYRSLGNQVVFFETGAFDEGSMQVAPNTVFGGEFGFIAADRRHRLVQLYTPEGRFDELVLIREFRSGSDAVERPPPALTSSSAAGRGAAATISADWPEPDNSDCQLDTGSGDLQHLDVAARWWFCAPTQQISHREAFVLEGGWLVAPGRMERLIRRYDSTGAWQSASHEVLTLC